MATVPTTRPRAIVRLRRTVVLLLDMIAAAAALYIALALRVPEPIRPDMVAGAVSALPIVASLTLAAHLMLGLQPRLWRYASLRDLLLTAEMALIVAAGTALVLYVFGRAGWMPRSLPAIHWLVMSALMMGLRIARRLVSDFMRGNLFAPKFADRGSDGPERALLAGCCDRIETMLRNYESNPLAGVRPAGILSNTDTMPGMKIRGIPVLGVLADLEHVIEQAEARGRPIARLIFASRPEELREGQLPGLVARAEGMGLTLSCLPSRHEGSLNAEMSAGLRPIELGDLLDRPQTEIDTTAIRRVIAGKRVLITGAGGTIGRELARQVASMGPSELSLIDASEFGLYGVDLELREAHPDLAISAVLCSIRQRNQLMRVFNEHRPDIVYHAAALKHVPLVEEHPGAGVQTNVIGTRNVADAANRYGTQILVQVSTDKAVNPIGLMGATKRLGELYIQALDIAGGRRTSAARFMTVRFGNVLGSSGSLIPLFQRQLASGKPLTVTHPDIERYFMTVQEAVQLVLQASARTDEVERGRIFVLDMGQPIKVMDIAKRMIRLVGKVPDRDVKIEICGLRPGEKLYEELFNTHERRLESSIPGIFEADPEPMPLDVLNDAFPRLQMLGASGEDEAIRSIVFRLLSESQSGPDKTAFEPALATSRHGVFFTPPSGTTRARRPQAANQPV